MEIYSSTSENKSCIKTKAFAKDCAKNTKLENLEMEPVVIYPAKCAAKFAESLCQERHAMIEKTHLQRKKL
jgi:hypothetical protein